MSNRREIEAFVSRKIESLRAGSETGSGNAAYAMLRRGIGKAPGDLPTLWGILLKDMPASFGGTVGTPSHEEWACYTALTLYALHQQGSDPRTESMYRAGVGLGAAMRSLALGQGDTNAEERMLKRLNVLATAKDTRELAYYLRGIIELLKSGRIALDHAKLAGDLYTLQFPEYAPGVRLQWGREFFYETENKMD